MNCLSLEKKFKNLIVSGKLSHSYIFFGENQKEIFNFARNLANFLESGKFVNPSKLLQDLFVVIPNEKGNIGIDEIRELQKFLYSRPAVSKKRTVIVVGFENLTDYAQSAILKIVEDSPKQALIILIGHNPENLLSTVVSRFQKFYFPANDERSAKKQKIKLLTKQEYRTSDDRQMYDISKKNSEDQIEKLNKLIIKLSHDVKRNHSVLKEALNRLSLMRRFNLNKKLQMKVVEAYLKRKNK